MLYPANEISIMIGAGEHYYFLAGVAFLNSFDSR